MRDAALSTLDIEMEVDNAEWGEEEEKKEDEEMVDADDQEDEWEKAFKDEQPPDDFEMNDQTKHVVGRLKIGSRSSISIFKEMKIVSEVREAEKILKDILRGEYPENAL